MVKQDINLNYMQYVRLMLMLFSQNKAYKALVHIQNTYEQMAFVLGKDEVTSSNLVKSSIKTRMAAGFAGFSF